MAVLQKSFRISTRGHGDVLDVTQQVARVVAESRIQQGIVNIAGVGSTLAITTLEFEPGCVADLRARFTQPTTETPCRGGVALGGKQILAGRHRGAEFSKNDRNLGNAPHGHIPSGCARKSVTPDTR